jgi:hypothetical protein
MSHLGMKGSAPAGEVTPGQEPRSERLNVATLRRAVSLRMWGGKGCGAPCDFCRVLVASSEIEYEVEADLDGEIAMLHFHPSCHDAWRAGQEPSNALSSRSDPPSDPEPPAAA